MQPYTVLDDIYEIEALPEGREKELRKAAIKPYRQMQMPQPDFMLCCNNICNCMTKWYENIARMCNIPLIIDRHPLQQHCGGPRHQRGLCPRPVLTRPSRSWRS